MKKRTLEKIRAEAERNAAKSKRRLARWNSGRKASPARWNDGKLNKKARRKKKPAQHKNAYSERALALRALGFSDYRAYLASALWRRIRKRVFKSKGGACHVCGLKASQIHHADYKESTMRGTRLKGLIPVCGQCHLDAEYTTAGKKRSLQQANERMRKSRAEISADRSFAPARLGRGADAAAGKAILDFLASPRD